MTERHAKSPGNPAGPIISPPSLASDIGRGAIQPDLNHAQIYRAYDQTIEESTGIPLRLRSMPEQAEAWLKNPATERRHGSCEHPVVRQLSEGTMTVPCRYCRSCRRWRVREWTRRSLIEGSRAKRTWFSTLTFRPYSRNWLRKEADGSRSEMDVAYCLISAYIKRVRALSGAPLKYISSVEPHKDGSPHLHLLIFQTSTKPVCWEDMAKSWHHGWVYAKLANPSLMIYACKYLTKQLQARRRIRVSRPFGKLDEL